MLKLVDNCAFISAVPGTDDYLMSVTGTGRHLRPDQVLTDQDEVSYYAVYEDASEDGFEAGVGVWNDTLSTLEVSTITSSSNNGAKVSWLSGNKIVYIVASTESLTPKTWWAGKDKIVIGAYGDGTSRGNGGVVAGVIPDDDGIFVYVTPSATVPYDTGYLALGNYSPDAAIRTAEYASAITLGYTTYTGQMFGGNGNPAWAAAYQIRQETGLPVYVYQCSKLDTTQEFWSTGNGWATLEAQAAAALALIPGEPEYFDILIGATGATDQISGGKDGVEFGDDFAAFETAAKAQGWWHPDHTRYIHLECPQVTAITGYTSGWSGYARMVAGSGDGVTLVSSSGLALADSTNYTPAALVRLGEGVANSALGFVQSKPPARENTYIEKLIPVLGGDLNAAGFDIDDVGTLTADAVTAPAYNGNHYGGMTSNTNLTSEATITGFPARVIEGWTANTPSNLITPSYTTGIMTVPTGGGGTYRVTFSGSATCTASKLYTFALYKNSTAFALTALRGSSGGDLGTVTVNGVIALAAADTVSLQAASSDGGTSLTLLYGDIFMERIGA